MSKDLRLHPTTVDNPYSPFTDWTRWYMEDLRLGYNTLSLWSRLGLPMSDLDESVNDDALQKLIHYNFSGKHIAVVPSDYNPLLKPMSIL